jgi:methionine-rich copper-binding protein CopC
MHRIAIIIAVLPSLLFTAVGAGAHAFLDRANPLVGSSVSSAPREVVMWFTQDLEPAFSKAEVRDANGARVDNGKASVDRADRSQLRVSLRGLPPGVYKVFWHVLSVDTHTTEGNFTFRVGK